MKRAVIAIATNPCFALALIAIILAMMFWWHKRTLIIEGNFVEDVTTALQRDVNTYKDNDTIMNVAPEQMDIPATNHSALDLDTVTLDTVTAVKRPDVSFITTDNCSTQSLLTSDYKNDICSTYEGDYQSINQKCNALSNDNCNYVSCCVLLNGNKCVAGNANGPTYLTDQGNAIDYNYYKYRGKVYPEDYNFVPSKGYVKKCGKYANNSTHVSKECMIQMFNDAGCTNKTPTALINDIAVYEYSNYSKKYIQNDLENAVSRLKKNAAGGDDDSRILCYGANANNVCDVFNNNNIGVSQECMIRMFNDAGCPNNNTATNGINSANPDLINKWTNYNKRNLKSYMQNYAANIKNKADTSPNGSDLQITNKLMCYG